MNTSSKQEAEAAKQEVVAVANALMRGAVPFVEGVRKLAGARFRIPEIENETDFLLFTGIDSQSDHIPVGEARSLCAASWLEQCDKEAQELEDFYKQEVVAVCEHLVRRFANAA